MLTAFYFDFSQPACWTSLVYKICMAGLMDTCYQDLRQFIAGTNTIFCSTIFALLFNHGSHSRPSQPNAPNPFGCHTREILLTPCWTRQQLPHCPWEDDYSICVFGKWDWNYFFQVQLVHFVSQERQYVTKQLKISLSQELERELGDRVLQSVDVHERLKQLLPRTWPDMWKSLPSALIRHSPSHWTKQKTFPRDAILLSPSVLQPICECLFQFESQYAVYNPALFAMYIPGLVPDQGLAKEREATQHFFANYSKAFGSRASNKRKYSPLWYLNIY